MRFAPSRIALRRALCRELAAEYGIENVGDEHPGFRGTKIDVVLRRNRNEFWYYEIKTALSPRGCLREALGQLLEYAYWPGAHEARRLIICGESPLDQDGKTYLRRSKDAFAFRSIIGESLCSEKQPKKCASR
jgi:hypothetical protein